MSQDNTRKTVYLVTQKSPQTQLFADYLGEKTGCNVCIHPPAGVFQAPPADRVLVLIDSDHVAVDRLPAWQQRRDA
ncbi:hypothetical protein [Halomonas cibimaris]|uniref:hypothetical protein n=1 Tax=Halomonas cibimaris TaxID=657012 RepID=UPI0031E32EAC